MIRPKQHGLDPALILLPDPDAVAEMLLGEPLGLRMITAAEAAGFSTFVDSSLLDIFPGVAAFERERWEPRPALVMLTSSYINPRLLVLIAQHLNAAPLEAASLYDAIGRPVAWLCPWLTHVPDALPISPQWEFAAQDPSGANHHTTKPPGDECFHRARILTTRDKAESERDFLQSRLHSESTGAWPLSDVDSWLVRHLARYPGPFEHLEFVSFVLSLAPALLILVLAEPLAFIPAMAFLCGALLGRGVCLTRYVRNSQRSRVLLQATPALSHAMYAACLTYQLMRGPSSRALADAVIFAAGAGIVGLSLLHARRILHLRELGRLAITPWHKVVASLKVPISPKWAGIPLFAVMFVVCAFLGGYPLMWLLFAALTLMRIWRWFAEPPGAYP